MLCRDEAVQLRRDHQRFLDHGMTVVAIGNGAPEEAAQLRASLDLPYPVLADPERHGYRAFGLTEGGWRQFLQPGTIRAYVGAFRHGARPDRLQGSATQLPGSFVVDREGIVRFARPANHPGDTATTDELLAALNRE